jgi:segregation and condensation protein A
MLIRQENKIDPVRSKFGKIEKDKVNMDEKFEYVKRILCQNKCISFCKLLENENSKMDIIVTFLVILELMKMGHLKVRQDKIFDDIEIYESESGINNGTN